VTHLLDTDTCVDALREREPVAARAIGQRDRCAVATVTVAELLHGAARSAEPDRNRRMVADLVDGLAIVDLDWNVGLIFGELKAHLRAEGTLLPDFDLVVAATGLAHSLVLVTANTRHFARIPDLRLENWRD
jgi:predicted nucleic acid-binding protein